MEAAAAGLLAPVPMPIPCMPGVRPRRAAALVVDAEGESAPTEAAEEGLRMR